MKKILILILLLTFTILSSQPVHASSGIVGPDVIYKPIDKVLTLTTIKDLYSSANGPIAVLEDNYTGFGNKAGIYTILLDDSVGQKLIEVSVRTIGDVVAATKTGSTITIHMHKNQTLTQNGIITVLENIQYIQRTSTTAIFILTDTYSANKEAPGNYTFEFHLADTSGFEDVYLVYLKVTNTETLLPDLILDDPNVKVDWSKVLTTMIIVLLSIGAFLLIIKTSNKFKGRKRGII